MLKARLITALFLAAGFLAVLFLLPHTVAAVVFLLVALLAAWEWGGLLKAERRSRWWFVVLVALSCLISWAHSEQTFRLLWVMSALFWLLVAPLWLFKGWRSGAYAYLVGWLLLVPSWAALIDLHGRSSELLLAVMALVWVADIAAYFTGRALGRRKLAPAISPSKTWEGVAGSLAGVLLLGGLVGRALPETRELGSVPLLLALCLFAAFSVLGDLFESLIKRQAGVKDSGALLPGHGGVLDRIDSQTSTLPLAALALHLGSA